jgi:hypothetical protein
MVVADQMIATNPGAQVGHDMKAALERAIAQGGGR